MKTRLIRLNPVHPSPSAPLYARPRAQSPAAARRQAHATDIDQERRERLALLVSGELSPAPR